MATIAAAVILSLLFLQLPRIPGSEILFNSKVCGANHLAFSGPLGDKFLFFNGHLVDKVLFCDAVKFHLADGQLFKYCYADLCGLDILEGIPSVGSGFPILLRTYIIYYKSELAYKIIISLHFGSEGAPFQWENAFADRHEERS